LEGRTMKKIEAILPLESAQRFIDQLDSLEVENLMTTNVTVIDKKNPRKMIYRGCVYESSSARRIKVELEVADWDAERAESLLAESVMV
jgi:nitrogen regulatory protein PII